MRESKRVHSQILTSLYRYWLLRLGGLGSSKQGGILSKCSITKDVNLKGRWDKLREHGVGGVKVKHCRYRELLESVGELGRCGLGPVRKPTTHMFMHAAKSHRWSPCSLQCSCVWNVTQGPCPLRAYSSSQVEELEEGQCGWGLGCSGKTLQWAKLNWSYVIMAKGYKTEVSEFMTISDKSGFTFSTDLLKVSLEY